MKFIRIPTRSIPKETPEDPRYVPKPPPIGRQMGLPREDMWWQQDPFPPEPEPYNPNNAMMPLNSDQQGGSGHRSGSDSYGDHLPGDLNLPYG